MASKNSNKKVIVTTGVADMTIEQQILHTHAVEKTCQSSAVYLTSQPCKDAMAVWMARTDDLDAHAQDRKAKENALELVLAAESGVVRAYANAAEAFTAAVQVEAKDNPKIPLEMGLALRAEATEAPEVTVPTGVAMVYAKLPNRYKMTWDPVPGAALYTAQIKAEGAADDTYETLFGRGTSRTLPVLPIGQAHLLRVRALGMDGKPSGWCDPVSFVAK
jgi:hypothetical protein